MTKEVLNLGSAPNAGNGDPIRVAFQKVSNNFDHLYQFANSTANTLTVVDGRIVLANSNVATLRADLTTLDGSTAASVALLNSNVSALAITVASNLQTSKNHANTVAAEVQSNVSSLSSLVALNANSASAGLADLLGRITGSNAIVSGLFTTSSILETRTSLLENSVVDLTNTVSVIGGMIQHDAEIDSAIDNLIARAGTADNAIMGLQGSLTSLSGSLSQNIADLSNQANGIQTNLSALGIVTGIHSSSISSLTGQLAQTDVNVAIVDARANTISDAVFVLDNRITNAVSDLATASGQIAAVHQSSNAVLAFAQTVEDRVEVVENAVTLLASNVAATIAITNANVATLAANTASTFVTANARMDSINATISNLAANSLGDAAAINARLNAAATHANATNNPHSVTTAQIGAVPTSSLGVAGGVAELDGLGKLKYIQRPSYGYNDFITGLAQIDFLPNGSLKLGSTAAPWANAHVTSVHAQSVATAYLNATSLIANATSVVISQPLALTNVGTNIFTVNGDVNLYRATGGGIQLQAANSVVLSSGNAVTTQHDYTRGDVVLAARDDVVIYSNLEAGWAGRKEVRFQTNGAITTSTFSLSPTASGLEFACNDFIITSNEIILNTSKPLVVSGVDLTYGGNAVYHQGNFDPATKVNVADYSNAAILAKLITVDGTGTGLDADLLDGQHGDYYREFSNLTNRPTTLSGYGITDAMLANASVNAALLNGQNAAYYRDFGNLTNRPTTLSGYGITDALLSSAYTAADVLSKLLTVDGTTSGLDADLLDGQHGSYYLNAASYTAADVLTKLLTVDGTGTGLDADLLDGQHGSYYLSASAYTAADVLSKLLTVDGAGTNLDADLLDGQQGSFYQNATNITAGTLASARLPTTTGQLTTFSAGLILSGYSGLWTTSGYGKGVTIPKGYAMIWPKGAGSYSYAVASYADHFSILSSTSDDNTGSMATVLTANSASSTFTFGLSYIDGTATNGPRIVNGALSTTVPKFAPNRADTGTGVGSGGTGQLALIASSTEAVRITSTATTVNTTLAHNGLLPTAGTEIDQIKSVTDSLTLSTSWQDTSVNATDLATGTYIIQVLVNDLAAGGTNNNEFYSGIMSWYSGDTDSTASEEVILHRAGVSPGGNSIFLRIARTLTAATEDMKLQIASTNTDAGASNVILKFRRMI